MKAKMEEGRDEGKDGGGEEGGMGWGGMRARVMFHCTISRQKNISQGYLKCLCVSSSHLPDGRKGVTLIPQMDSKHPLPVQFLADIEV